MLWVSPFSFLKDPWKNLQAEHLKMGLRVLPLPAVLPWEHGKEWKDAEFEKFYEKFVSFGVSPACPELGHQNEVAPRPWELPAVERTGKNWKEDMKQSLRQGQSTW